MDIYVVNIMLLPELIITLGILGWFIIIAFAILLSIINKYVGVLGIIVLILVGLDYWSYYVDSNSTSFYLSFLTWFVAVFIMFETIIRIKTNRR